ncbi:glycosyltransferase family 2 protein [Magnetospirillum sp. 15-1]|uniref:glycosyltransferase family 2 protein n=1 Tax=Magnetospirillum sp. 15-1 TaxID=1979370 RepID=UPI000BBC8E49|nr:glycosyltransferase family 2 protein [Magnetospirillum sp. 15-1]
MVSVVIPAYNENNAIAATVQQVAETLKTCCGENYEVIVVDDGSSDDTGAVAMEAGARVVRHPHNVGYGKALKSGIGAAEYDTIVITDADGTYPIDHIPVLLEKFSEGFDMVVGARTGDHYKESALKWPMRLLLRFLVEWTAGRRIPDINSGLRVFSKSAVTGYFSHLCDTFSFTTSLTLAYMMTGRFVTYLPIPYAKRIGKTKVRLWRDSLRTLQFIVQAITYYNPLKIYLLMALLCSLISVVAFMGGLAFHLATAFLLCVGAMLVGILVFALGLLADLLRQIMAK